MAPVAGRPGWTAARREAFLAYHRRCRAAAVQLQVAELTNAVIFDHGVAGALRLAAARDDPTSLEVGLWLGRRHRGRGIGAAAVIAAVERARGLGAITLIANTTPTNAATLALLRVGGFRIDGQTEQRVTASLRLD